MKTIRLFLDNKRIAGKYILHGSIFSAVSIVTLYGCIKIIVGTLILL